MIKNILLALFSIIVLGGLFIGAVSYFSYDFETNYNADVQVMGLNAETLVHWRDDRVPVIEANNETDLMTGLGYSHALRHALSMTLLRQVALGELNKWYGAPVVAIDRQAHTLGFADIAKNAYYNLPQAQQKLLQSYTKGINAVIDNQNVAIPEDLMLAKVPVEKWEAWHSLAIERLVSWLGTDDYAKLPSDTIQVAKGQTVHSVLDQFAKEDRQLRDLLKYNDFQNSLAWTAKQNGNTLFFQRHVTGASAHPLIQEAVLRWSGRAVKVASIPGTLMFPAGQSERIAWHVSLTSNRTIEKMPAKADSAVVPAYTKLVDQEGNETLVTVKRNDQTLYIPEEVKFKKTRTILPKMIPIWKKVQGRVRKIMIQADSTEKKHDIEIDTSYTHTWAIHWSGFQNTTDTDSWLRLMRGDTTNVRFKLIKGNGLMSSRNGSFRILGNPSVREPLPDGILVTDSPWGKFVAQRVRDLIMRGRPVDEALEKNNEFYSIWAEPLVNKMIKLVNIQKNDPWASREAITYLRNWAHTFENTSIPATIFDTWVARYAKASGQFIADTTAFSAPDSVTKAQITTRLKETLVQTTKELFKNPELKQEMSQWIWSVGQAGYVFYPLWTATYLPPSHQSLARNKFAPVNTGDGGHPSTLHWRATRIGTRKYAPMAFEAWTNTKNWRLWTIQHPNLLHEGMLARYSFTSRLQVLALPDDAVDHVVATTTLHS